MIQSDNLRINLHIFLSFLIIMIFFAVRISAFIPITDINSYLFAVCILGMFSFLRRKAERDPTVHYIYQIILSFCLMEILLLTWNFFFLKFFIQQQTPYSIFRLAYYKYQAPSYGAPQIIRHLDRIIPVFVIAAGYLVLMRLFKDSTRKPGVFLCPAVFILLFIIVFAATDGPVRIFYYSDQYMHVIKQLKYFSSVGDILRHYVKYMPQLGIACSHYPPGILLLFKLEQQLSLYLLVKIIVVLSVVLSVFPLKGIMKQLGLPRETKVVGLLSYSLCPAILIYSSFNFTPVTVFLGACSFYYFIKGLKEDSIFDTILFGLYMCLFLLITFNFFVLAFFIVIYTLMLLIYRIMRFKVLIKHVFWAALTISTVYILIYTFTGFNIVKCFLLAVRNNSDLGDPANLEKGMALMFRSTGNILAFAAMLGGPFLLLVCKGWRRSPTDGYIKHLGTALLITLVLLGFSGLFYLETERVWIFFVPFFIPLVAMETAELYRNNRKLLFFFFLLSLGYACVQEIFFDHSLAAVFRLHG